MEISFKELAPMSTEAGKSKGCRVRRQTELPVQWSECGLLPKFNAQLDGVRRQLGCPRAGSLCMN